MSNDRKQCLAVSWLDFVRGLSGLSTTVAHDIRVRREVVPIVFVAGFLGSRLELADGSERIWDPDFTGFMFVNYGLDLWGLGANPAARKRRLVGEFFDPDRVRVMDQRGEPDDKGRLVELDKRDNRLSAAFRRRSSQQSWQQRILCGGIASSSYGKIVSALTHHPWPDLVRLCFDLPVHTFGYNWMDDVRASGKKLVSYLDQLMQVYHRSGRECRRVILVTHSMGGLVARAACVLHGASDKVLGVVHGAQPATGSPVGYWVMKGGFSQGDHEDLQTTLTRWVLGKTGAHVAPLLGHMPGALQLLPSSSYRNEEGRASWLRVNDHRGREIAQKPRSGDPYQEIYAVGDRYWGVTTPELLCPTDGLAQLSAKAGAGGFSINLELHLPDGQEDLAAARERAWQDFLANLNCARDLHRELGQLQHPNTYHLWARGKRTASSVRFRLSGECTKERFSVPKREPILDESLPDEVLLGLARLTSSEESSFSASLELADGRVVKMELQPPEGPGDDTVPISSGRALAPDEQPPASDGEGRPPREFEVTFPEEGGPGHSSFFDDPQVQKHVFRVITRICRDYIQEQTHVSVA